MSRFQYFYSPLAASRGFRRFVASWPSGDGVSPPPFPLPSLSIIPTWTLPFSPSLSPFFPLLPLLSFRLPLTLIKEFKIALHSLSLRCPSPTSGDWVSLSSSLLLSPSLSLLCLSLSLFHLPLFLSPLSSLYDSVPLTPLAVHGFLSRLSLSPSLSLFTPSLTLIKTLKIAFHSPSLRSPSPASSAWSLSYLPPLSLFFLLILCSSSLSFSPSLFSPSILLLFSLSRLKSYNEERRTMGV